jgi:hypothetical protein
VATSLNRESELIPGRLRRGKRANPKKTAFLTVEDPLQLAAGIFNQMTSNRVELFCGRGILPRISRRGQSSFGEVGSLWLEPTPMKWLPVPS